MMSDDLCESERVVLRAVPGQPCVEGLAQQFGWELAEDNAGQAYERYSREQWWHLGYDRYVHSVCDKLSGYCALTGAAPRQADADSDADSLLAVLAEELDVFSREELMAPMSPDSDPRDRIRAVMRLALGAFREFDREVFSRVSQYAEDPEPAVRDAAIWSSGYVAWPSMRSLLRKVAQEDPHEAVRQDARIFLQMYDSTGVPEP